MTGRLAHIVRHPIKSVGWEEIASVSLTPDATLPMDRHWAIAHAAAGFEGTPDGWQAKRNFVRGVAGPELMAVRAELAADGRRVALRHPRRPDIDLAPDRADDAAALIAWVAPLWPETRPSAARVVSAGTQALTDVAEPFVSVLNLASLRALGAKAGQDLSIHRFRGNLWIDGAAPWAERGWVGRELRVGPARLRIEEPINRCNATAVNPESGQPDLDTLTLLEQTSGDRAFGVYARVTAGGTVHQGDPVILP